MRFLQLVLVSIWSFAPPHHIVKSEEPPHPVISQPSCNQGSSQSCSPFIQQLASPEGVKENTRAEERTKMEASAKRTDTLLTAAIAGAAICQVMVALWQGWIYRRQSNLMSQGLAASTKSADAAKLAADTAGMSMRISSRAWVSAHIEEYIFQVGKPFRVTVTFKNTGTTPALSVRTCQVACLITKDLTDLTCPMKWVSPGPISIAPGGSTRRNGYPLSQENDPLVAASDFLTPEVQIELQHRSLVAVTYGRVDYEDVFGIRHWTTFYREMRLTRTDLGSQDINWQHGVRGNEIDKNN